MKEKKVGDNEYGEICREWRWFTQKMNLIRKKQENDVVGVMIHDLSNRSADYSSYDDKTRLESADNSSYDNKSSIKSAVTVSYDNKSRIKSAEELEKINTTEKKKVKEFEILEMNDKDAELVNEEENDETINNNEKL